MPGKTTSLPGICREKVTAPSFSSALGKNTRRREKARGIRGFLPYTPFFLSARWHTGRQTKFTKRIQYNALFVHT